MLEVKLLNGWEVILDGRPVDFGRRIMPQQLLAYGSFHIDEDFNVKALFKELFPDNSSLALRANLNTLKRQIKEKNNELLPYFSEWNPPRLNPKIVKTDVQEFWTCCRQIRQALQDQPLQLHAKANHIRNLYGRGLLPGDVRSEWLKKEREDCLIAYSLLVNGIYHQNDPDRDYHGSEAIRILRLRLDSYTPDTPQQLVIDSTNNLAELLILNHSFGDADTVLNRLRRKCQSSGANITEVDSIIDRLNSLADAMNRPSTGNSRRLMIPVDTFVGPSKELDFLVKHICHDQADSSVRGQDRLLVVYGPPGVGKTRILRELFHASEVEKVFGDARMWLQMISDADAGDMLGELTLALDANQDRNAISSISRRIRDLSSEAKEFGAVGRFLIVVDADNNVDGEEGALEHDSVIGNLRLLLESSRELMVIVSSPTAAACACTLVNIPPIDATDSARLYKERAQASGVISSDFSKASESKEAIYRHTGGLPLLIEIMALSAPDPPSNELAGETSSLRQKWKERVVQLVTKLSDSSLQLISVLAVFRGGWNLDAACFVAGATIGYTRDEVKTNLRQLTRMALVQSDPQTSTERFYMVDPIREVVSSYCQKPSEGAKAAHLEWIRESVKIALGKDSFDMKQDIEVELQNLRAALEFTFSHDARVHANEYMVGANLVNDLFPFWHGTRFHNEGLNWGQRALVGLRGIMGTDTHSPVIKTLARMLLVIGILFRDNADYEQAHRYGMESYELAKLTGNHLFMVKSLTALGNFAQEQGNYLACRDFHEQALSQFKGAQYTLEYVHCLNNLASACEKTGDHERTLELLQQAIKVSEKMNHQDAIGLSYMNKGNYLYTVKQCKPALFAYEEAYDCFAGTQNVQHLGECLHNLGNVYYALDKYENARLFAEKARTHREETQQLPLLSSTYHLLGAIDYYEERYESAAAHYIRAIELSEEYGDSETDALTMEFTARLFVAQQRYREAALCWGRSEELYKSLTVTLDHVPRDATDYINKRNDAIRSLGQTEFDALIIEGTEVDHRRVIRWLRKLGTM